MLTRFTPRHPGLACAAVAIGVLAVVTATLAWGGAPNHWAWLSLPVSALLLCVGLVHDERQSTQRHLADVNARQAARTQAQHRRLDEQAKAQALEALVHERTAMNFRDEAIRSAQISIWQADLLRNELTVEGVHLGSRDFSHEVRRWRMSEWLRSLHPEDRRRVAAATEDFYLERRTGLSVEFRLNDERDGWRWVLAHGDILTRRPDDGRPLLAAGTLLDIHHHKLTQIARGQERGLLEAGPVVVFRFRLQDTLTLDFVSGNAARLWKRDGSAWQPQGRPIGELLHPDDAPPFEHAVLQAHAQGDSGFASQVRLGMGDGSHRWQSVRLMFEHEREASYARGYVIDIEERKHLEALAADRNRTMQALVAQLHRSQADTSALQECSDRLNSAEDVTEASRIISHVATLLFPHWSGWLYIHGAQGALERATHWGRPPAQDDEFGLQDCWALRRGKSHVFLDDDRNVRCRHLHSAPPDLGSYLCIPMAAHGETVGSLHLYAHRRAEDEAELAEVQEQAGRFCETVKLALSNLRLRSRLKEQATRDALTGLYNRRLLDERLPIEFRRSHRDGQPLSLALMDIDHFKSMNDEHGHDAGDAVLRALGAYLIEQTRAYDLACRYGGEELVLLMPGCQTLDAVQKLEAIRQGIESMQIEHLGERLPPVTVSIGLARSEDDGPDALLRRADAALYRAKHQGRNRLVVHDPERTLSPGYIA